MEQKILNELCRVHSAQQCHLLLVWWEGAQHLETQQCIKYFNNHCWHTEHMAFQNLLSHVLKASSRVLKLLYKIQTELN